VNINDIRMSDGKLPAYAWPGGYPLYYLAKDNGVLCPKCANEFTPDRDNDEQLEPVAYDVNWEDDSLYCEHCNARIESAYGEESEVIMLTANQWIRSTEPTHVISPCSGLGSGRECRIVPWPDERTKLLRNDYPFVAGRTPQSMNWLAVEFSDGTLGTFPANRVRSKGGK
jgi:hypothetical protein